MTSGKITKTTSNKKAKKTKKKTAKKDSEPEPVPVPVEEVVEEEEKVEETVGESDSVTSSETSKSNNKKRIELEDILEMHNQCIESIEEEIEKIRSNGSSGSIRFLNRVKKMITNTSKQTVKFTKQKRKTNRKAGEKSGFMKPIQVSGELCKFTGWDENELHSRVDVTKFICNYIKTNNLQNPEDKRKIIPDKKLTKILNYNPKTDTDPVTYFRLQRMMKHHFTKT